MALVCGSERIFVDKVTLFAKLELFNKNPALLGLREYELRSDVSSSIFSTFIELIGGTEFDIRDDDAEGLGRLAAELGHTALAAACQAQMSSRSEKPEGCDRLKREVASIRERQERQEAELLSIRDELRSLRQSLSVKDRDVCEVSRLVARQASDEREIEEIWSSVGSLVKSVCERSDQVSSDVLGVNQEIGRVGFALRDLTRDVYEEKGRIGSIEIWREATGAVVLDLKREVLEVRELLEKEVVSTGELMARVSAEVAELRREVGMLDCAKGRLEAEIGELRKHFEAEQNYRRFCELFYCINGCDKSFGLGVRFLALSADSGHSDAQHQYSRCHCEGSFVVKDYSICWRYAELSGSSGNATGQFRCGYCLYSGFGVAQDFKKAAGWHKLSADQGHARGQNSYGLRLEYGKGVVKDLVKAAEYYKLSADQGNASGQYNYGVCLEYGKGVVKNLVKAAQYFKLAADQGRADAREGYSRCSNLARNDFI
jgi:hypothetical protein